MRRFAHRAAVYFGLTEPSPEDQAHEVQTPSLARRVFGLTVAVLVLGLLSALFEGDFWQGILFDVVFFSLMAGIRILEARSARN